MPEIPGYPYQTAPGYVPTHADTAAHPAPVAPVPVVPVAAEPGSETYAAPAYEVAHNYVVPTVTQTYYATADTYIEPAYEAQQPVQYAEPVQYAQPVQPAYVAPVSYAPAAAVAAAPAALSRTEQRKREEEQAKASKKRNSIFKAWWLYPLIAAIAVCGYLGWRSAQVPVSTAPTIPVVIPAQP